MAEEKARKRKKRKIKEQKAEEPPMTAMIDIIFQLLIFFILTMKIKTVEGKLINQLPKDKGLSPNSSTGSEFAALSCSSFRERLNDQMM